MRDEIDTAEVSELGALHPVNAGLTPQETQTAWIAKILAAIPATNRDWYEQELLAAF